MQKHHSQSIQPNLKMSDEQCRVVMKFEEKRQLLQAILDRKDQLFGPVAAKMKPNLKQQLWDETISTFKRACPESTAELSAGYVRGIFWQNLRKRTLAKKERALTDQNVKFDELDDLVVQILGEKALSTPPLSRNQTPMNNNYSNISDLFPFLNETLYSQLSNGNGVNLEQMGLQFSNNENDTEGHESPEQSNQSIDDEWRPTEEPKINKKLNGHSTSLVQKPLFKKKKYSQLGMAKLAQIEAQTARLKAETKLLELKYVVESKKHGIKLEKLADGRQAFIIQDSDAGTVGTVTDEDDIEMN